MSSHLIKEYDDLKKILKNSEGRELYSHIVECFNNLILYYPDDALDKFEEVSYLLKDDNSFNKGRMREFLNFDNKIDYKTMTQVKAAYAEKAAGLFSRAPNGEDGEDPVEPSAAGKITDLNADREILEWAGISFGEEETFRLQVSLTRLSIMSGSDSIRFWGKIFGTEKDYYIAEGFVAGGADEEAEKPKGFEDRGTGINQYVYWVSSNSLDNWKILPDISPDQLAASRSIKVKFTGNLERNIITNPFFFGQEKHYLRAQIARITHSTTIMPGGLHKITEDNPKEIEPIEFEDEAKAYVPTTETQSALKNWVHSVKSILKCNRVNHMEPDGEEFGDMEPEEIQKLLDARDKPEPRLKPLVLDDSASSEDSAWTLRLVGDQTRTPTNKGKSNHYGVVVVKSTVWTGAVTCWREDRSVQIYIGDGLKNESACYYPVFPPFIPDDPEDLEENPEPTPLEAPAEEFAN